LDSASLSRLCDRGTAIAHCPLSNAYFSAQPFRLGEALNSGVKIGLGTDVAGGYSIDIMNAMRQAVSVSRMREGSRLMSRTSEDSRPTNALEGAGLEQDVAVEWKQALYMATRGGALALNAAQYRGMFEVGASFDAQCGMFTLYISQLSTVDALSCLCPSTTIRPGIWRCRGVGFLRFREPQRQAPVCRNDREVVVSGGFEKSDRNVGTGRIPLARYLR
jgi:hypothetical protein